MAFQRPDPAGGHRAKDSSCRFEVDTLLRQNGYRIQLRTSGMEPYWEKNGITYRQTEALIRISPDDIERADFYEKMYRGELEK